jgi:broad specificity phosphatase PhoE
MKELEEKHKETVLSLSEDKKWKFKYAEDIESDHELAKRFVGALREIAENNKRKTILVVAHGGTIRSMLVELGYARLNQLPRGSIDNAAFAKLVYDGS